MADIPTANQITRYVDPQGRLTPEGWTLIFLMLEFMREIDARVAALEP